MDKVATASICMDTALAQGCAAIMVAVMVSEHGHGVYPHGHVFA